MKKQVLFIASLICSMIYVHSFGTTNGFFNTIINNSPYEIRIKTSDKSGSITLKNGQTLTGDDIQNKDFYLSDIKAFNLTIPWQGWDGDARIKIDVLKKKLNAQAPKGGNFASMMMWAQRAAQDAQENQVAHGELMDRNSQAEFYLQGQKLTSLCRNFDTFYTLIVDASGTTMNVRANKVNKNPGDVDWCDPRWSEVKAPSTYVGTCWPGSLLKQKDACADWCQGSINNVEQWTCSQNKMYCICKAGIKPGSHNVFNAIAEGATTAGNAIGNAAVTAGNAIKEGAEKLGSLVMQGIDKAKDVAHSIRDAVRTAADKISDTPNVITQKAADVIGQPDLAAKLLSGADKLNAQIKTILATIDMIKKQKEDVKKQNLSGKGFKDLKELNALLVGDAKNLGAFDEVIAALNELVSPNCKTGALCEIQTAFRAASLKAQTDENSIKSKIQELDRQINHPTLAKDGVVESLPNRLRNLAKLLDI